MTAPVPVLAPPLPPAPAGRWRAALKASGLPPTVVLVGHRLLDYADGDLVTRVVVPTVGEPADATELPRR